MCWLSVLLFERGPLKVSFFGSNAAGRFGGAFFCFLQRQSTALTRIAAHPSRERARILEATWAHEHNAASCSVRPSTAATGAPRHVLRLTCFAVNRWISCPRIPFRSRRCVWFQIALSSVFLWVVQTLRSITSQAIHLQGIHCPLWHCSDSNFSIRGSTLGPKFAFRAHPQTSRKSLDLTKSDLKREKPGKQMISGEFSQLSCVQF